jgi:hypothetical protein
VHCKFRFALCLLALLQIRLIGAVVLTGEIMELTSRTPIAGASVSISQRQIIQTDSDLQKLLPLEDSGPGINLISDANGQFTIDLPEGFVSVRVQKAGYAAYFNAMVRIDTKKGANLVVELIQVEPSEIQTAILDHRREEAQIAARMSVAEEPLVEAKENFAAAQPVVPTDVYVSNLNGFTGLFNLDEYITGVISLEMGDGFPYEALKAQAVAARTYALARLRDRGFANGGQAYTSTLGTRCKAATYNSSGVALTYGNSYITAFFSARCNGDYTLSSEDGLSGLATCTPGGLVGKYVAYLRKVACSGHINCSQTAEQCCVVNVDGRTQHIYGHGVGLCQRGAQQFANRDGWNWQQIYNRYYTSVFTLEGNQIGLADRVELTVTANRRPSPCSTTSTSTALGAKGTLIDGPSAPCLLNGTYYTWWRVALDNGARGWIAEEFLKKVPAAQTDPTLNLSIDLTTASTPFNTQITAATRANLRIVFEESTTLSAWTPVLTNAANTNGIASFTTPTAPDERHFRARLMLPDTLP